MKRRDFVKICSACACGGLIYKGYSYLDELNKLKWYSRFSDVIDNKTLPRFPHIEVHLAEHCNLNCKYCCHFSSIAKPSFYETKQYEKDMEALANALNGGFLHEIKLLGGEPLLHPQINDILKITKKYLPNTRIDILTNAVLLDYMDESFWKTVADNDIVISPSIYNIDINWESILAKGKKYNAKIMNNGREYNITPEDTKKPIKYFYKFNIDLKGKQNTHKPNCMYKLDCNYKDGKLYRCFLPSNIEHFNNKFRTNIPVSENDYIDIYKINNIYELISKFKQWDENYSFCKYCKIGGKKKWENTKTHDISEWT